MFVEADLAFELNEEERELAVLGYMVRSFENYKTVCEQVTEEDFSGINKHFFRTIGKLYKQNGFATFDDVATLGEELGIIIPSEGLEPNEGYQQITKMIACSDDDYSVQMFINLLKDGQANDPSVREPACNNKYINNIERDIFDLASKRDTSVTAPMSDSVTPILQPVTHLFPAR